MSARSESEIDPMDELQQLIEGVNAHTERYGAMMAQPWTAHFPSQHDSPLEEARVPTSRQHASRISPPEHLFVPIPTRNSPPRQTHSAPAQPRVNVQTSPVPNRRYTSPIADHQHYRPHPSDYPRYAPAMPLTQRQLHSAPAQPQINKATRWLENNRRYFGSDQENRGVLFSPSSLHCKNLGEVREKIIKGALREAIHYYGEYEKSNRRLSRLSSYTLTSVFY